MKVDIKIMPEVTEAYAIIYTNALTEEIQALASAMETERTIITAKDEERLVVLQPKEIFMVRVEGEKTLLYTRAKAYASQKRLYELEAQLGRNFMRISKSALINLREIDSVETSFNGMMLLIMKNNCKEYISRKYLPGFKKYLGI